MAKASTIAETENTLLLRTHFGDDAAWKKLCAAITKPVGEYQAYVTPLSDARYDGLSVKAIVKLAKKNHAFVLVADEKAITEREHAVLVIDLDDNPGKTFRVIPREAWSVENNLSIANMDFIEFLLACGKDGVFRGFPG
jgi:hypothetical protein